jgi:hypothetical protein
VHAPIIFGPGIGGSVASMMNLLQRIASHGFVIIGRQLDGGPNNPENNRRMIAGLDWLIAQNTTAGSTFEGKLDVQHAASMGYSVGRNRCCRYRWTQGHHRSDFDPWP